MNKESLSILSINLTSGGAEKVISLLLTKLVHDYEVTLVLFYNEMHFEIPRGVETVIYSEKAAGNRNTVQKLKDFIFFVVKYHNFLKKRKVKFSIAFLPFPNIVSGIIALFNKKCKMIISQRGFPSNNPTSKLAFISKVAYPLFYNRCDLLFSNSIYINKDLEDNYKVNIPMAVIYNPIRLPKKIKTADSFIKNGDHFKIISIGSLDANKNHDMILKAMSNSGSLEMTFSILGNGPLRNFLERRVNELNIDGKVTFYGTVKNIGTPLLEHDCFVLSSFTEGFPNALFEAMSYGLPCISTNCVSGPLEMLNENNPVQIAKGSFVEAKYGILVNVDDDLGLSRALQSLRQNPDKLRHYGKMSLERASSYKLDKIYAQFRTLIQT